MTIPIDSSIFGPLFGDDEISAILTDNAYVRSLVEVEIALARAESRLGVIPSRAALEIAKAKAGKIDLSALSGGTVRSGFPIIALVQELRKQVHPDAAAYLHWGATTQDIMDTASVLQLRSVIELLRNRLRNILLRLSEMADRHRATVLAGRTHGQQALPVTFGLKVAAWMAPLVRQGRRLDEISSRLLVVQFGGAAGTLAALGDKGLLVAQELAEELKLAAPEMPWHAQRDNFAEFAGWLSLMTGSLAKMAQDILLLAQTEVGEVAESTEAGRGGSSTMPQKSNPITSELIVAAARMNASLLSSMHQALIQEQERATHGWQLEWLTLPQMIVLTGGALKHASYLAQHLQADEKKMRENMARANDLVLAEAVSFALSAHMPRADAHETVSKACAVAVAERKPLVDAVRDLVSGRVPEGAVDWNGLRDPANYLGETQKIIDRMLKLAGS